MDFAGTTPTPAPEPAGAKKGGSVYILSEGDFEFLDPQNIYVTNSTQASILFHRTLVGYIEDPKGRDQGRRPATNAGATTDNGKTWTYTLRDGAVRGRHPITSQDVAYGLAVPSPTSVLRPAVPEVGAGPVRHLRPLHR
jgi:peptide/nickel transport system substrate-binding protein